MLHRAAPVLAGEHDEAETLWKRFDGGFGVGARQRACVNDGVRSEAAQFLANPLQFPPVDVQMFDGGELRWLMFAAVNNQHRMAVGDQLLDDCPADELRSAEDGDPHVCASTTARRAT
jgi:hypothetical protein